jgi:hypothetical protein
VKKSEKPKFYSKKNFFLSIMPFCPWAALATWLHVGATKKMSLIPVFNKNLPRAHTES